MVETVIISHHFAQFGADRSEFRKWGRLVGRENLDKMAKNCLKITKSKFWGQNRGRDKSIFG